MQEENSEAQGEITKPKRMSISKKGFAWYTLFSFLLVTLMIFTAVMLTYNGAEKTLGATYSKQIALRTLGFTEDEVTSLSADKTFYKGSEVFKVVATRDGVEHTVYIDSETAKVYNDQISAEQNG